jgi:hypothetical protein
MRCKIALALGLLALAGAATPVEIDLEASGTMQVRSGQVAIFASALWLPQWLLRRTGIARLTPCR